MSRTFKSADRQTLKAARKGNKEIRRIRQELSRAQGR